MISSRTAFSCFFLKSNTPERLIGVSGQPNTAYRVELLHFEWTHTCLRDIRETMSIARREKGERTTLQNLPNFWFGDGRNSAWSANAARGRVVALQSWTVTITSNTIRSEVCNFPRWLNFFSLRGLNFIRKLIRSCFRFRYSIPTWTPTQLSRFQGSSNWTQSNGTIAVEKLIFVVQFEEVCDTLPNDGFAHSNPLLICVFTRTPLCTLAR